MYPDSRKFTAYDILSAKLLLLFPAEVLTRLFYNQIDNIEAQFQIEATFTSCCYEQENDVGKPCFWCQTFHHIGHTHTRNFLESGCFPHG